MKSLFKTLATGLTAAFVLAACGGGGDGGGAKPAGNDITIGQPTIDKITGKAIDGYLVGATVCLDLNNNGVCDAGEPTTTTDGTGGFALDYSGDATGKKLIVQIDSNTRDLSRPGYVFPATFALTTTVEGMADQHITPLTTIRQSMMEFGMSKAEAELAVQNLTGVAGGDIGRDFVAAGDPGSAAMAARFVDKLTALAQNGATDAATVRIAARVAVDTKDFDAVTPDQVQKYKNLAVWETVSDASTTLGQGQYSFQRFRYWTSPDYKQMGDNLARYAFTNEGGFKWHTDLFINNAWVAQQPSWITRVRGHYRLKADGTWTDLVTEEQLEAPWPVQSSKAGSVQVLDPVLNMPATIEFRKRDVSGLKLSDVLFDTVPIGGEFAPNTDAYLTIVQRQNDLYDIPMRNCPQEGIECTYYGDPNHNYQSLDEVIGQTVNYNDYRITLNADGTASLWGAGESWNATWTRSLANRDIAIINMNFADLAKLPWFPFWEDIRDGGNMIVAVRAGHLQMGTHWSKNTPRSFTSFRSADFDKMFSTLLQTYPEFPWYNPQ